MFETFLRKPITAKDFPNLEVPIVSRRDSGGEALCKLNSESCVGGNVFKSKSNEIFFKNLHHPRKCETCNTKLSWPVDSEK
jgi:hypothetical protein